MNGAKVDAETILNDALEQNFSFSSIDKEQNINQMC